MVWTLGKASGEDLVYAQTLACNLSQAVYVQVTPSWRQEAVDRFCSDPLVPLSTTYSVLCQVTVDSKLLHI